MNTTIKKENKKIAAWKQQLQVELNNLQKTLKQQKKTADSTWDKANKIRQDWVHDNISPEQQETGLYDIELGPKERDAYTKLMDKWYAMNRDIEKLERRIELIERDLLPTDQKYFNEYCYSDVHAYACVEERTPDCVRVIRMNVKEIFDILTRTINGVKQFIQYVEVEDGSLTFLKNDGKGKWINTTVEEWVEWVKSGATLTNARQMSFIPGGFFGHTDNGAQKWRYEMPESWTDNDVITLRRHKNGAWYQSHNCNSFRCEDEPYEFYDFNF